MESRRRSGQSLIEVIVACLLVALITIPIVAAALSGHQLTAKASARLQAAADVRRVSEALKAYVVADKTLYLIDPRYKGPGSGISGWALPGDNNSIGLNALDQGHHPLDASTWLPGLDGPPHNGTISYDVTVRSTPQGDQPDVVFNIAWTDQ
ncbi:MAG: type II secretion system protein [Elusimicrobiota bacterium]